MYDGNKYNGEKLRQIRETGTLEVDGKISHTFGQRPKGSKNKHYGDLERKAFQVDGSLSTKTLQELTD